MLWDNKEDGDGQGQSGKKPVLVPENLHSALKETQKQFKKQEGVEPALGELVEEAFKEDPAFRKVLEKEQSQGRERSDNVLDENFMRL